MGICFLQANRWPTLDDLQKARPATLRQFFHQHNCRSAELIEQRLKQIGTATPATNDPAVIQSRTMMVQLLVQLLATLRQGIAEFDRKIAGLFVHHPDFALFNSLPGAGPALAPRLLAALGTQRERYGSAQQIQSYAGIAPVVERSGNTEWIHFRRACPKFLRQTFHEWAGHSIGFCQWAREFYQHQRAKNKSHHAAVRALAFKWIRILYRCWKDRTPYDNQRHEQNLRRRHASTPRSAPVLQWQTTAGFFKFSGLST